MQVLLLAVCMALVGARGQDGSAPPPADPKPAGDAKPTGDAKPGDAATPADAAKPAAPKGPRRVWIFIDRFKETGGVVENEDDANITIKDRNGKITTYPKGRLMATVELLNIQPPFQLGIIRMRDGSTLHGKILADDFDQVEYEIAGVRGKATRDSVIQVFLEPPFEERYETFKKSIKPTEVNKRLDFAKWLIDERRYDLAREELLLLTREVDLPEARDLLKMVEAQLVLSPAKPTETPGSGTGADQKGAPAPHGGGSETPHGRNAGPVELNQMLPTRTLSPDDVNIIRVYEVDLAKPPRMDIPADVIRDLITKYGSSDLIPKGSDQRNQMFTWEAPKLLKLMYDLKARDLYTRVKITSEPWSLNLFRTKVHDAWMIPNCATSACHGGINAGRLFLHRKSSKEERVRYTNLLILLRSKLDHPLVDFEDPESSLIVQYALPRDEARYPHPEVKGWKPIFTGNAKQLKSEALQWIRAMYRPRPEYPVDYEPPRLDAIDRATRQGDSAR